MSVAPSPSPPPLVEGQRLDQPTFHARYEAMPPGLRAELIGGVVFMPSPLGPPHGRAHGGVAHWLTYYQERTPGVEFLDNTSTVLGPRSELQPDAQLRIASDWGGRTRADRRFVTGAPELVLEIADTTRATDFGPKRDEYERAGVLEYVVRGLGPDELAWHVLEAGRLARVPADGDGLCRSRVFPGLWLDPSALISGDTRRLREVVDLGVATPEHAAFVARLAAARAGTGCGTAPEDDSTRDRG